MSRNQKSAHPEASIVRVGAVKEHAGEAADFLKALANEQRLMVLCALLQGSLTVGEINERVQLSQSALSQHLAVMRAAELVTTKRESQAIRYSLVRGPALRIMEVLYEAFCSPAADKAVSRAGVGKRRS